MILHVAVAVIFDSQERVLIAQRPLHAAHGGLWEFPGGKLEANELPSSALAREIKEEVGIDIIDSVFLGEIIHDYGNKVVKLLVFASYNYQGKASCCESQLDLRWVSLNELADYHFPEANKQVIDLIKQKCGSSSPQTSLLPGRGEGAQRADEG